MDVSATEDLLTYIQGVYIWYTTLLLLLRGLETPNKMKERCTRGSGNRLLHDSKLQMHLSKNRY